MTLVQKIKRVKFFYYIINIIRSKIPYFFFKGKLKKWLQKENLNDTVFKDRLSYYISPTINTNSKENWIALKNYTLPKKGSFYYYDLLKYTKYFPLDKKITYKFGDVTENFDEPTIVKSRPINHNGNSVLMKINELRHFNFVKDKKQFHEKKDLVVWRGEIHKENRRILLEKFYQHPLCNIGEVSRKPENVREWEKEFLNIEQQLEYKFIVSIEGNDVATNLKWIMASNSLCFMPTPKFETWFMEGRLIPDFHYVHLDDNYTNLIEKRNYYLAHPEEALKIIKNANDWVKQFQDEKSEKTFSIHVLDQFFKQTNQY